jgi:hypothetical protein
MKTSNFLKLAKSLIDAPAKWSQRYMFDIDNRSSENKKYCSLGAYYQASIIVCGSMKYTFSGSNDLTGGNNFAKYNDSHTHSEVMKIWDRAIELAEQQEKCND